MIRLFLTVGCGLSRWDFDPQLNKQTLEDSELGEWIPWNWTSVDSVRIAGWDPASGDWAHIGDVPVESIAIPTQVLAGIASEQVVETAFGRKYNDIQVGDVLEAEDAARLASGLGSGGAAEPEEERISPRIQNVVGQLQGGLVGYPAPGPRSLKLVHYAIIDADQSTSMADIYDKLTRFSKILVAPIFSNGASIGCEPHMPSSMYITELPSHSNQTIPYRWDYVQVADRRDYSAIVAALEVVASPLAPDDLIDPSNLWITMSKPVFTEDWTSRLEEPIASCFDLVRRIIDAFQALRANPQTSNLLNSLQLNNEISTGTTPVVVQGWRDVVASCLRDLADAGMLRPASGLFRREAPDRSSLLGHLLTRFSASTPSSTQWSLALRDEFIQAILAWQEDDPQVHFLTKWRDLIKGVDANLGSIAALAAQSYQLPLSPPTVVPPPALKSVDKELTEWEKLLNTFSDNDFLQRIVFAQWDAAVAKSATTLSDLQKFWAETGANIARSMLAEQPLRNRLLRQNIGAVWSAFLMKPRTGVDRMDDAIAANFVEELPAYFLNRVVPSGTSNRNWEFLEPKLLPDSPVLINAIRQHIYDFADSFVKENLFPPEHEAVPPSSVPDPTFIDEGDVTPTKAAHSVSIQIDSLSTETSHDGRINNPLRHISGVGLLLRSVDLAQVAGQWRCLSTARVLINRPNGGIFPVLAEETVVPTPIAFQNGIARVVVEYNNASIVAPSPLLSNRSDQDPVGLADEMEVAQPEGHFLPDLSEVLIFDRASTIPTGPGVSSWSLLPGLRFGGLYDIAAFAIGNGGVLPRELLGDVNADPTTMRPNPEGFDVPAHPMVGKSYTKRIRYSRRTEIGAPRWSNESGAPGAENTPALPPIGDGVAPLAREIPICEGPNSAVDVALRYYLDTRSRLPDLAEEERGGILDLAKKDWVIEIDVLELRAPLRRDPGSDRTDELTVAVRVKGNEHHVHDFLISRRRSVVTLRSAESPGSEVSWNVTDSSRAGRFDLRIECNSSSGAITARLRWSATLDWLTGSGALTVGESPDYGYLFISKAVGGASKEIRFAPPRVEINGSPVTPRPAEPPLLMMAPSEYKTTIVPDQFDVFVRPPATSIDIWDRWRARDQELYPAAGWHEKRVKVLASFYEQAPKEPNASPDVDLTLDDPAADAAVVVELVPLFVAKDGGTLRDLPISSQAILKFGGPRKNGIPQAQSDALRVRLRSTDGGVPTLGGLPLVATIPAGMICELRIWAASRADFFVAEAFDPNEVSRRFAKGFADGKPIFVDNSTIPNTRYFLHSPIRLIVESAQQLPTSAFDARAQEKLYDAIKVRCAGSSFLATLNRNALDNDLLFEVETRWQGWHWDGRPIVPFPFEASANPDGPSGVVEALTPCMLWEADGFGERADSDFSHSTKKVPIIPGMSLSGVAHSLLHEENLPTDLRAHYFRFGFVMTSRYRGLRIEHRTLATGDAEGVRAQRTLSIEEPPTNPGDPPTTEVYLDSWHRCFMPSRVSGRVNPPAVKLLIPLTERVNQDDINARVPAAGLLVAINQSWFDVAGLAERLDVELAVTPDPNNLSNPLLPELGSDPIVRRAGIPPDFGRTLPFGVIGPVGHTTDTQPDVGLSRCASFIVEPDVGTSLGGAAPDLTWAFSRTAFRRVILPESRSNYVLDHPQSIATGTTAVLSVVDNSDIPVDLRVSDCMTATMTKVLWPNSTDPTKCGAFRLSAQDQGGTSIWTCPWLRLITGPALSSTLSNGEIVFSIPSTLAGKLRLRATMSTVLRSGPVGGIGKYRWRVTMSFQEDFSEWKPIWISDFDILGSVGTTLPRIELNNSAIGSMGAFSVTYSGTDSLIRGHPQLQSDATAPRWGQLLPVSNRFQVKPISSTGAETIVAPSNLNLRIVDGKLRIDLGTVTSSEPIEVLPLPFDAPVSGGEEHGTTVVVAVITRVIQDARGREDERYLTTMEWAGQPRKLEVVNGEPDLTFTVGDNLRARIVEIQKRLPSNTGTGKFWAQLMPDPGTQMEPDQRIVRFSPPIDLKAELQL